MPRAPLHFAHGHDRRSRSFRDHIRTYNSALSFVSFGAQLKKFDTKGPPVCVLHGALYHYSYELEAPAEENAKFAQLYMYDHAEATSRRMDFWDNMDASVLQDLTRMLEECNPLIGNYRQMRDVSHKYLAEGRTDIKIGFAAAVDADTRRYNHPTKEEVAAVFVAADGAPPGYRDLVIWPRDEKARVHRVDIENEHVDPCTYALLLPTGDLGWNPHLQHAKTSGPKVQKYIRMSPMQFYAYKLMVRQPFNPLPHSAGFLFQQYIVDAYCKAEARRLQCPGESRCV